MHPKKLHSLRNLKKSSVFAGGIGLITVGAGLAVSIPVYFAVQKALNKKLSEISDLSKYFKELSEKLGISPDEKFVAELEGGYELVFSNGQTVIYQKIGDDKVLVLDKNANGTIGTAGSVTGPGAQGILDILESAKDVMGEQSGAIEGILGPIKDQIEEESLANESAVTGLTPEEIKAKNALSNDDAAAAEKALQDLIDAGDIPANVDRDKVKSAADAAAKEKEDMEGASDQERQDALEATKQEALANIQKARNRLISSFYKNGLETFYDTYVIHGQQNPNGKKGVDPEAMDLTTDDKRNLMNVLSYPDKVALSTWIGVYDCETPP